jgi:hypothetical protein
MEVSRCLASRSGATCCSSESTLRFFRPTARHGAPSGFAAETIRTPGGHRDAALVRAREGLRDVRPGDRVGGDHARGEYGHPAVPPISEPSAELAAAHREHRRVLGRGHEEIDCTWSVFVCYTAFFSLLVVFGLYGRPKWDVAMRFVVGWSFFPFFLIPRSVYLYRCLIPLMFGCMAAGAAVERACPHPTSWIAVVALSPLVLSGFYLWCRCPLERRTWT